MTTTFSLIFKFKKYLQCNYNYIFNYDEYKYILNNFLVLIKICDVVILV